jgi:hypothetical protein
MKVLLGDKTSHVNPPPYLEVHPQAACKRLAATILVRVTTSLYYNDGIIQHTRLSRLSHATITSRIGMLSAICIRNGEAPPEIESQM